MCADGTRVSAGGTRATRSLVVAPHDPHNTSRAEAHGDAIVAGVRSLATFVDRVLLRWLRAAAHASRHRQPVLDLHGFGVADAIAATERFLEEARASGIDTVRIVYGKGRHSPGGRGVLREVIPRWLAADGRHLVASATPEPDAYGEDAAIVVSLHGAP